ncbi:hypothetical protein P3X46_010532 [Hevea brasiliensis]|uniref:Pentacotripeptide-repeat region of PRORP domain-containing protein n=1 Tax=Hevea brasiliensis TaxID=3981 RepID=A0ABQ9MGC0_HEVBR|nr:hypothetical protein P3X46_010532 [Hevea brasiliensis]
MITESPTGKSLQLQLQRALSTIQSPCLLLFTRSFHSSAPTSSAILKDAPFFRSKFKSASFAHLDDALVSFNHVIHMHPLPSRVQFNQFLSAFVRMKQCHTVVSLSKTIELLGVSHDIYSLSILINCFCHLHLADFGFSILGQNPQIWIGARHYFFGDMVAGGYEPDVHTYTVLVNSLCIFGKTNVAIGLLKGMVERDSDPDTVTYIIIIGALCKDKLVVEALDLFSQMRNKGISTNVITYNSLIHGLCKLGKRNQALAFILIDILCKEGMVSEAQNTFKILIQRGLEPNVVTYNSLIDGLCISDQWKEALALLKNMVGRNISSNVFTFNKLINTLCKKGLVSNAQIIIRIMIQIGVEPGVVTYNSLMDGYLFNLMVTNRIVNVFSYNILINGYCKSKRIDEAKKLFDEMPWKSLFPNSVTFNALIKGLWQVGWPRIAKELFKNMCSHGPQPNIATYRILLDGLCKQGDLDEALTLFKTMEKSQFKLDNVIYTILIDGLFKAGKFNDAKELFSRLSENGLQPDFFTYGTIIKGLCKEGLLDEAYKVFSEMKEGGCLPNSCYNVIVQGFLRHKDVPRASQLIDEIFYKGFFADDTTTELVFLLLHGGDLILRKL